MPQVIEQRYVWHRMPDDVRDRVEFRRHSSLSEQKAKEENYNNDSAALQEESIQTSCSQKEQKQTSDSYEEPKEAPLYLEEPEQECPVELTKTEEEPDMTQESHEESKNEEEEQDKSTGFDGRPAFTSEKPDRSHSLTGKMRHTVHFRGAGWKRVLKEKRAGLEKAFKKDVCEATALKEQHLEDLTLEFNNMLLVAFTVRPENDPRKSVHTTLQKYNFAHTVALYKTEPVYKGEQLSTTQDSHGESKSKEVQDKSTGHEGEPAFTSQKPTGTNFKAGKMRHTVHFRGAGWKRVLKEKRAGLEKAFKKDVCEATALKEQHLEDLTLEFNNMLLVAFTVRPENDPKRSVHSIIQKYNFAHTVALYKK